MAPKGNIGGHCHPANTFVDVIRARPLRARDEFWKQVEMGAKSVPPMIASNRLDFAKLT